MRHWLVGLLLLIGPSAFAQQAVPSIAFDSVPNPLRLPPNMYFGEVSGVSVNSKGHVFVLSRGNTVGAGLCRGGDAVAGIRRQRPVRPRNRQEPLCLVVRTHRQGRSLRTTSG